MYTQLYFWIPFLFLAFILNLFSRKYNMLKDISTAKVKPYSWSKVQLAWWTIIILASFIAIIIQTHSAPDLNSSTLILLGISAATTATSTAIDVSEINDPSIVSRSQDNESSNLVLDILSDKSGISISRFQTVVFNFVFSIWFIVYVLNHLGNTSADDIMPVISDNNLILLGLGSATYAALKTTENKTKSNVAATTPGADAKPGS